MDYATLILEELLNAEVVGFQSCDISGSSIVCSRFLAR